jgi:hypothetical protein
MIIEYLDILDLSYDELVAYIEFMERTCWYFHDHPDYDSVY